MKTYTTIQGDCWDGIAYKLYGSTSYVGYLMAANLPLLDTFVFEAGVVLQAPDLPQLPQTTKLPTWRRT